MVKVLIGTSGWSYDDWAGIVYPPGAPSRFDRLLCLADLFDTLEVNSSFYRIPSIRTTESWIRRTADRPEFMFSLKLYQGLTHHRPADQFNAFVEEYRNAVMPIHEAGKLAAILMQFPWSFRNNSDNVTYVNNLIDALRPFPLALEVRHLGWLDEELIADLSARNVAFTNIDQPALRQCLPPTTIGSPALAYVRLHGRNAKNWFADNTDAAQRYNYLYNDSEISEWTGRIQDLAGKSDRILVYTNNHFCGQAVANALQIKAILLNRRLAVPAQLIYAFPQLQDIAEAIPQPPKIQPGQTATLFDDLND